MLCYTSQKETAYFVFLKWAVCSNFIELPTNIHIHVKKKKKKRLCHGNSDKVIYSEFTMLPDTNIFSVASWTTKALLLKGFHFYKTYIVSYLVLYFVGCLIWSL